jgi:succinate dehydrogenase / fumarate reductase membrane anchor subunit
VLDCFANARNDESAHGGGDKMLQAATSLGRSGLQDWIIQRVSAIVLAFYVLFMVGFFILNTPLEYATWVDLFEKPWTKILHLFVLLSLMSHAWIGFWTISTDYVKPASLRLLVQVLVVSGLFFLLVWGVVIIWSV